MDALISIRRVLEGKNNKRVLIFFLVEIFLLLGVSGVWVPSFFTNETLQNLIVLELEAWRWTAFCFHLVAGGIVAKWVTDLVVFLVGRYGEQGQVGVGWLVANVVVEFRQSVQHFLWVAFVLYGWLMIIVFTPGGGSKQPREETGKAFGYIARGLVVFLVGLSVWLVKCLLLEMCALYIVVFGSDARIKETIREQNHLRDICENIGSNLFNGHWKRVLNNEHNSLRDANHWISKFVINGIIDMELPVLVGGEELKQMLGDDDRSIERIAGVTGDRLFEMIAQRFSSGSTSSDSQKKASTKHITYVERRKDQDSMRESTNDLLRLLKEVIPVKHMLQRDLKAHRLWKSDFVKWMVKVYRNRVLLLRTLNGRDDVVGDLNRIVSAIVFAIVWFLWLLVTGVLTTQGLLLIITQLLALFKDSAKTVFETIFFLFVTQPFDVGDRVKFDTEEMVVHDMNIQNTVFKQIGGEKRFCPNSSLLKKDIVNFSYIPDSNDTIEFNIVVTPEDTTPVQPKEKMEQLKSKIQEYLATESEKWNPNFNLKCEEEWYGKRKTLGVSLEVHHAIRFYIGGDRTGHRDELASKVKKYLEELQLTLYDYDDAVSTKNFVVLRDTCAYFPCTKYLA